VPAHADLAWRCWTDECVVHHRLSNDTHRLSIMAAEILIELAQQGELDELELARRHDLAIEDMRTILQQLAQLDLVHGR
jgi:hypothetical protein